jgi:hypothetical protein
LVVSNIFLFSISYMGCHPSHWRTPSFFKMVMSPPTSCIYIYIYIYILLYDMGGEPMVLTEIQWLLHHSCEDIFLQRCQALGARFFPIGHPWGHEKRGPAGHKYRSPLVI